MSGRAANQAAGNVIDIADDSPDAQPFKRQRRDGAGAVRNVRRQNDTQGGEQVIDLTHFPDRLEPNGDFAAHARQPRQNYADVPGPRRDAPIRAHRRGRVAPDGAAPGPGYLPRLPVVNQLVQAVPPVHFPAPAARAAPRVSRKRSKGQHEVAASTTPPQEDSAPTCAICLDSLKDNLCCAPCGHVFHYKCLREAVVKFKYCPTCRKAIKGEKTIKKIFL